MGQGSGIKQNIQYFFGAPFFPRPARVYADLLMKRLENFDAEVYLVNTDGLVGRMVKVANRFSIPTTRAVVTAIVNGDLKHATYETLPGFNLQIPN